MEVALKLGRRVIAVLGSLSDQSKLTLLVTSLVGAGLIFEWASQLGFKPQGLTDPRILVARRNMAKGATLTQLDMTTVLGTNEDAERNFTDQQLPIVLGSKLRFALRRGDRIGMDVIELANKNQRLTDQIPVGYRAYSFRPDNDLPVRIGNKIDLIANFKDEQGVTRRVADGVEILDQRTGEDGTTLVVAVLDDDLSDLEKARQSGKLVIALRGSSEKDTPGRPNKRGAARQVRSRHLGVQILVEGDK